METSRYSSWQSSSLTRSTTTRSKVTLTMVSRADLVGRSSWEKKKRKNGFDPNRNDRKKFLNLEEKGGGTHLLPPPLALAARNRTPRAPTTAPPFSSFPGSHGQPPPPLGRKKERGERERKGAGRVDWIWGGASLAGADGHGGQSPWAAAAMRLGREGEDT